MTRTLPRLTAALALAATLAVAGAAPAQDSPPPSPASLVAEVQVIAKLPGPALWRVSTPTSQLWILGLDGPLPKDFKWDNRRVVTALDGARELVLPPVATGGVRDLVTILLDPKHILHLPRGETMRGDLPADLKARWDAAARAIGADPAHYDRWRPFIAALALDGEARRHYRLGPWAQGAVVALAKSKHVKARPLADYKAGEIIRELGQTPLPTSNVCIALVAGSIERMPADAQRRAAAWAIGDLKTLKALKAETDASACLDAVPAVTNLENRASADTAKGLALALATPGKTVVAADLDELTRKGGLLDQLKAQGLEVIGPTW